MPALGARADLSGPLSPSLSRPTPPSPWWPRSCPRIPGSPRCLDRPPALSSPVRYTRLRAQSWRRWRRRYAYADSPRCHFPLLGPAVGSAEPLFVSAAVSTRLGFPCGGGGFCPLPALILPPPELCLPQGSLWRFLPPRATLPLRGCLYPLATRLPSPLHGGPPQGFRHFGGLWPPSLPPTPEDSPVRFSLRPATLSLSLYLSPWWPPAPASSATLEVTT